VRAVEPNEFKLKAGMHHRFNSTSHCMLQDIGMRKAYTLLESGCQVAQAAYRMGYKRPNELQHLQQPVFEITPNSMFGRRRCGPWICACCLIRFLPCQNLNIALFSACKLG